MNTSKSKEYYKDLFDINFKWYNRKKYVMWRLLGPRNKKTCKRIFNLKN